MALYPSPLQALKKKDQGLGEILKKLEDAGGLDVLKACGDYEKRANKH